MSPLTDTSGLWPGTPLRSRDVAELLRSKPSLERLSRDYPSEWAQSQRHLARLLADGGRDALKNYLTTATGRERSPQDRIEPDRVRAAAAVRRYMTLELVRQACVAHGAGMSQGPIRFGRVNGFVLQRLLFERGLRRKPVSLVLFRAVWPLLSQRRLLLPLVMQQGIYCFYSRRLVRAIARLVNDRSCLEIAAGDGTLSRFLRDEGVSITATDDFSWDHAIQFGGDVERLDARQALRTHAPEVVVCSWPPPGNSFEKHVFNTPSVQLYILLTSRHAYAAGNPDAYTAQRGFDVQHDPILSRLILPDNVDGAVYLFRRRPDAPAALPHRGAETAAPPCTKRPPGPLAPSHREA
ncbi:hypothetical protein [Aquipuribacter hungaricus]|uniref:SAM-dependent methyltransferase n=2 Tax=Aquipuribacter hungaricus TaxID=545624 RepID=A0ABV7WKT3_9MICO